MKNTKLIISLILSLVMMLSLFAACTSTEVPETSTPVQIQEPTTEPETPTETTAPVTSAPILSAEKDAELRADLQARIDEILNTETEIVHSDTFIPGETYTGTAYYVSNDGNDSNDGLTPETAWATLSKVGYETGSWGEPGVLKSGDAVLFRRGDIFRGDFQIDTPNLTLSTFGDGDKPIITSSSENGSGTEKWELVYEDDSGKRIWKFYRDMSDVSMIVLNNGEAITTRIYEYYDGNGYISCEATGWWMHDEAEGVTLLDKLLPLEESMTEDLTIISRPERYNADSNYMECGTGPLYLRCDKGNPGEVYESIEFSEYVRAAAAILCPAANGIVVDNISFRCNGTAYMKVGISWKELQNMLIQNCEFAYSGCAVTYYHEREDGAIVVEVQGDGIYNIVRNTTIQNNYFHDGATPSGTYEGDNFDDTDTVDGYFHYLNNVSVNTNGIRLDSTAVALQYLDSVKVCGNQVWNTGHMDQGKLIYSEGSVFLSPNHYGECIIEDNVFYGTENGYESNALFNIWFYEDQGNTIPQVGNNTYVQHADRKFGYFSMWESRDWYMNDPELLSKAAELLGDTTSQYYIIP